MPIAKMGLGKKLNKAEIKTILKLKEQKFSILKIAEIINRSRKFIYNLRRIFFRHPQYIEYI